MPASTPKRNWRYWRNMLLSALVFLASGLCLTLYVFLPISYANGMSHPKRAPVCCRDPGDVGLTYEEASWRSTDGLLLKAWYLPSSNRAAVVLAHGIAGNRLAHLDMGVALAQNGYGVLMLDLRAHGESQGETAYFGGDDILGAVEYLQARPEIDPQRIGALGISLGAMVAVQAAAGSREVRAVVADGAGPNDFGDLPSPPSIWHLLDLPFYWTAFQVWDYQGVNAPLPTREAIGLISPRPLLIIAGTASPFERALQRKLFAAASAPKELWEIPEAGHAGGWKARPEEYQQRILSFFERALFAFPDE